MAATTITPETTAAELIALAPADREAACRALQDHLASDFAALDGSHRNHETYLRRSREAGHADRADRAAQVRAQAWSDYDRLAHLKSLLARLTGRSAGYASRAAWRDECRAVDEAVAAGV